jgi:TRAP-type C4-dicarboxylate transport system permease small subunit
MKGAHITMDLVTKRLSRRPQRILGVFASLLGFGIGGIITYQSTIIALDYARHLDKATPLLSIPNAPFRIIDVLGFLLLSLILLKDIFRPLSPENNSGEGIGK